MAAWPVCTPCLVLSASSYLGCPRSYDWGRVKKPEAQVPKRPGTTLGKADSTSIPGLRPVASGPPDFDTLCDAAIAAVRAPTIQAKAASGVLHLQVR